MPKRILYVHPCAGMGGAPLSLLYLIEQLDPRRYEAEVLFIGSGGPEVDLYRQRGIPFRLRSDITSYPHARGASLSVRSLRPWEVLVRPFQVLPSARRMRDEVNRRPVDLVHVNTSVLLSAGIGAAWAGVPVVWHVRESLRRGLVGLRRWLIRACIHRSASAIIAISNYAAAPLLPGPRVRVIYNTVNFDAFDRRLDGPTCRSALGLPAERPIVLMLGGLVASKGADVFVKAAAIVRKRHPEALFLVAGYGPGARSPSPLKRLLRRVVESMGLVPSMERRVLAVLREARLEDTVRFTGVRSDVPQLLAASTLLVWPATVPHFARPIIEAGAMARPVVASDDPATREIVVDGETGLLVRPRDPAALAEGIVQMLGDRHRAAGMGEAGHRLARSRYDARTAAAAVMMVYDEVLGSSEPRTMTGEERR
jgi:glycosyltransferase involved in cell wall biosynthesis